MPRWLPCLLALGCAAPPSWREIRTPHFVLRADADAESAQRAAAALELNRDMLVSAAWPETEIPEWAPPEVFVLQQDEFREWFGPRAKSVSMAGNPQQFFFYGSPASWETRSNLAESAVSDLRYHLAIRLVAQMYPGAPRWFYDGLARFLETVHLSDDRQKVLMGAINLPDLKTYQAHPAVSLTELLAWTGEAKSDWTIGGISWLFVHWLINKQGQAFGSYREALTRGEPAGPAFDRAFPGFDRSATQIELHRYANHGEYNEVMAPLRATAVSSPDHLLTVAERHLVRARLLTASAAARSVADGDKNSSQPDSKQVKEEISQALGLDPTNVEGLWMDEFSPPAQQLAGARAATLAHPEDARAWELLAMRLGVDHAGSSEQEGAYRKAVELAPHNPDTLRNLAWLLLQTGRTQAAVPFAIRAYKRAAYDPAVLATYALTMFRLGNCTSALSAQERAVERLGAEGRAERPVYERHLTEMKTGCAKHPGAR